LGDGLLFGHAVHLPQVPCRADGDDAGGADQSNSPAAQGKMSPPMTIVFIEARRASGDMINSVFNIRPCKMASSDGSKSSGLGTPKTFWVRKIGFYGLGGDSDEAPLAVAGHSSTDLLTFHHSGSFLPRFLVEILVTFSRPFCTP
jgi:hypothetical protein